MKVALRKDVLEKAIKVGGAASLSEDALTNTSNISQIIQSVKITVDSSHLTFESVNVAMGSKTSVSVGAVTEGKVKLMNDDEGSILVHAKSFVEWVGWQKNNAVIGISFGKPLKTPELIGDPDGDDSVAIRRIGKVNLVSKDKTGTEQNWEIDCIDPEQATEFHIKRSAEKQFVVPAKQLAESIKTIGFACNATDSDHIYDNISVQHVDGLVYLASTNGARMAIAQLSQVTSVDNKDKMLIPFTVMGQLADLVSIDTDKDVQILYDKSDSKFIAKQGKSVIRVVCKDVDKSEKFHDIRGFVAKDKYKTFGVMSREDLTSLLGAATMGGNDSALFSFSKDTKRVEVLAKPDKGVGNPKAIRNDVTDLDREFKVVWSVKYLQDGLKAIKASEIPFALPEKGESSVKVVDVDNENFSYFIRKSDNPRYATELGEV